MLLLRLCLLIVVLLLPSSLEAKTAPKVYQTGLLKDIQIDSQTQTSYVSSGSSSSYGSATTTSSFAAKQASSFSSASTSTNSFGTLTPVTSVKNTYYFQVKLNELTYLTAFTPQWRQSIDTNWIIGKPVKVRLNEKRNRMYIQKPSGKDLKTKIIRIET